MCVCVWNIMEQNRQRQSDWLANLFEFDVVTLTLDNDIYSGQWIN